MANISDSSSIFKLLFEKEIHLFILKTGFVIKRKISFPITGRLIIQWLNQVAGRLIGTTFSCQALFSFQFKF